MAKILRGALAGMMIGLAGATYVIVREWWRTADRLTKNSRKVN